jgi:hypothetical protein
MKTGFRFSKEQKDKRKELYKGFSNSGTFKKGNKSWNEGKKRPEFSKEWKEKLRLHNLGNKSHTGEVHDEAYKKRMSNSCKGIPKSEEMKAKLRGANSPLWKGGISCEPYSIDWTNTLKQSIRERDHSLCQNCGIPQGDIAHSIHHIDYNKKNCDPKNLITLCRPCHTKTNHNRQYWTEYFQLKMKQIHG